MRQMDGNECASLPVTTSTRKPVRAIILTMIEYTAILIPDAEEPGYTVIFPDAPGCITEGDTEADALVMAADALSAWLAAALKDNQAAPPTATVETADTAAAPVPLIHIGQCSAQAVILGCTELPLIISPDESSLPLIDTTRIYAAAAVNLALAP